jgi:hypothetical protein
MILMILKHRRPLPTPEEAMHDLREEETTASLTKELGDASTGAALSLNVAAAMAEAVGVVDVVDAVDKVEAVEQETATKVHAPIAQLTAILQMHAGNGNALRREETTMSVFASSAGSQDP